MRWLAILAISTALTGCFQTKHYVDDASSMDGLFFGQPGPGAATDCAEFRAWALYGLVPWRSSDESAPGAFLATLRRRGLVDFGTRIRSDSVFTLGEGLVALVVGFSGRLLFAPRAARIRYESAAEPRPSPGE